jgi:chromatin remodeling complex protein RSC6
MVKAASNKTDAKSEDILEFQNIINDIIMLKGKLSELLVKSKHMQKKYTKRKVPNIKSGFVKPVKLSTTLSDVIGVDNNELVARSVVNKKINEYIKNHNLQVPDNKQTFVIDAKLSTLFGLEEGSVVHYFKMQTYLKSHYPKAEVVVPMETENGNANTNNNAIIV